MSPAPFRASPDLKRLRDEGYCVQIVGGYLVMREVPYVDAQRQVRRGTLISNLLLAGDVARRPDAEVNGHVVHLDGDYPCDAAGSPIDAIRHQSCHQQWGCGLSSRHSFSSKPEGGYADYFEKMATYAAILSAPARQIDPEADPRIYRSAEDEGDEGVFKYIETASGRAGIGALTEKLRGSVAIIGLGGSGGYILDFVAKTPVSDIRLFDADDFLQHNAFRAPGAPSIEELREVPKKVDHFAGIYSRMHRGITAHSVAVDETNLHLLDGVDFAFICIDSGDAKRRIMDKLESIGASFIDCGMGLELVDETLGGILRVTASTPEARNRIGQHVSFAGGGDGDVYASNIQVADLNALNAVMAVLKWKKLKGFYRDFEGELHSTYTTDGNLLLNEVAA
ncbi:ThiF family adenylyltransferase [Methylobacterium sp. C25]|uniref:ThiF family adenylyltransferase n=1 Tax=Methylobacterium sp. C25 TaxID=2721622 RepID=UPI001F1E256A|nr:ThiF family adenylyltransferase [Methylobacterium sp. C25]MCE4224616.1 ThiF family adenylyltransferase [Methylobacterium sp. C25]